MKVEGKKFNFLGDSITEGVGASDAQHSFVEVFRQEGKPACVRNYGIGGTRYAKQKITYESAEWNRDFCSRYREMDPDADVIVVFGGTNDYGHGDAEFGELEDTDSETFCGAVQELFSGLHAYFAQSRVIVLTPLRRAVLSVFEPRDLGRYAEVIRRKAQEFSFACFDLYGLYETDLEIHDLCQNCLEDGLHPNNAGHAILARKLLDFIEKQ